MLETTPWKPVDTSTSIIKVTNHDMSDIIHEATYFW